MKCRKIKQIIGKISDFFPFLINPQFFFFLKIASAKNNHLQGVILGLVLHFLLLSAILGEKINPLWFEGESFVINWERLGL